MSNTKDLVGGENNPKILLVGDGGTHKTWFLTQIPNIFVFDFDKGMAIARGTNVEYQTFKDAPQKAKAMESQGIWSWGTAWPKFINKLNEIGERIDKGERIPIGIDSLTTMSAICMNYVQKGDGRKQEDARRIQDWGAQIQLMEMVMDQLTAWPVPLVVTAHIQRNTNDITETIEMLPLLTGKLAGKVGIYFDEVYYTQVKGKGDKKEFVLQTESYGLVKQAKTRYGVPDGTPTEWEVVKKFYDATS